MQPFDSLTNRGQAGRLRRLAMAALQHYDLEVRRLRLMTNHFNALFRVDNADGGRYVLRVSLAGGVGHSLDEIRSETMWLEALQRDTDLGVPRPVPARDGALVTTAEAPGVPEQRHCTLFYWMPGRALNERLSPTNVARLAELAARLHDHAGTFEPPAGFSIPTADSVFPFREAVVLFDPTHAHLFPPARRQVFEQAIERVQRALDDLYSSGGPPRVLHYDLHPWNVRMHRGRLYVLDFEDLMWGHPVQDLAVALFYYQGRENEQALCAAFRSGYKRRRDWPERYPGEIDTLIAGRSVELANLILQDTNPDFRSQAPEYLERTERRLRRFLAQMESISIVG